MFKRGMRGVYQHCGEKHLHRYLSEFDFRYNRRVALGIDDAQRVSDIVRGADGKRLPYRRLTKRSFRFEAARFLRWRKKQPKRKA